MILCCSPCLQSLLLHCLTSGAESIATNSEHGATVSIDFQLKTGLQMQLHINSGSDIPQHSTEVDTYSGLFGMLRGQQLHTHGLELIQRLCMLAIGMIFLWMG